MTAGTLKKDWRLKAKQEQQEFCQRLGNRHYDEYSLQNPRYIQTKVAFAIFGPPKCLPVGITENSSIENQCSLGALLWPKEQRSFIIDLTDFVIQCAKNAKSNPNDPLKLAFIFVNGYTSKDGPYLSPVIRIHGLSESGFVDTSRRFYKNWDDYLKNNVLPPSDYLYPEGGIYRTDWLDKVVICEGKTPAALAMPTVLNFADTMTGWLGLGSAVVGIGCRFLFPPVALGAAIVGAGTGIWAGARSVYGLVDRSTHRQSISLLNSAARGDWLMIAGGAVGVASSGAMAYMRFAASRGRSLGLAAKTISVGLQGANITVNGLGRMSATIGGLSDTAYRIYGKNRSPDPHEWLQMAVSIYFFSHTIITFKTPNKLINEVQNATAEEYISILGKRARKKYNQKWKSALTNKDPIRAKAELIKNSIIKMDFGDYFFKIALGQGTQYAHNECLTKLKSAFQVNNIRDIVVNGALPLQTALPSEMRILEKTFGILLRLSIDRLNESKLISMLKNIILTYDPRNANGFINIINALITFISYFILNDEDNRRVDGRVLKALESSFPEFLELLDELKRHYVSATKCVIEFLRQRGGVNERALKEAESIGRSSEVEAVVTAADGDDGLLEKCLENGARFLGLSSFFLTDMAHYRIEETQVYLRFNDTLSESLGCTGFTVHFNEREQIEDIILEFPPSPQSSEPVSRLCC